MSNQPLDLLGDPIPDPLPEGIRLMDVEDLVGHKIRATFLDPFGRLDSDLVIVTETGCWITMSIESDGCGEDGASLCVDRPFGGLKEYALSDYVSASELLRADCITQPEYEALKLIEKDRAAKEKALQADRLRAQLARLEGGAA